MFSMADLCKHVLLTCILVEKQHVILYKELEYRDGVSSRAHTHSRIPQLRMCMKGKPINLRQDSAVYVEVQVNKIQSSRYKLYHTLDLSAWITPATATHFMSCEAINH